MTHVAALANNDCAFWKFCLTRATAGLTMNGPKLTHQNHDTYRKTLRTIRECVK